MIRVKRRFLAVGVVSVASLATAPAASLATTAPAFNFPVHVVVTNKSVLLTREDAKRGWLAHFKIQNKTNQPIRFELGGVTSKVIPAGRQGTLGVFCSDRGDFLYKIENSAKQPLKYKAGYFVVE